MGNKNPCSQIARNALCQTFVRLSKRTWRDIRDSQPIGIGEESITDYLLLHLLRHHQYEVQINKFSKFKEGRTTGADWEWWLVKNDHGFPMRIQAKRIDSDSLEYPGLYKKAPDGTKLQSDLLIDDAQREDCYPLYCFYNYWPRTPSGMDWNCNAYNFERDLLGCAIGDAYKVNKQIRVKSVHLMDIARFCFPWHCLVCCEGFTKMGNPSLPERARRLIEANSLDAGTVPRIREIPHYVRTLQTRREGSMHQMSAEELEFRGNVDGIMIIRERQ